MQRHVTREHQNWEHWCKFCHVVCADEETLERHMKRHPKVRFQCTTCGAGFNTSVRQRKHMATMHPPRNFKCYQCPESFTSNKDVVTHMLRAHSAPKVVFKCSWCDLVSDKRDDIDAHILDAHNDALELSMV